MGCCGPEKGTIIKYEENRSCTDLIFLAVFFLFWIAYIIVASIGFANGDPDRLLYGTDYLGFVCGKDTAPANWTATIGNMSDGVNYTWQHKDWNSNGFIWYPVPPNATSDNSTVSDILNFGVCVQQCPVIPNTTFDNLTSNYFNFDALEPELLEALKVYTYGTYGRLGDNVYAPAFYWIPYSSKEFYRRCLPADISMSSLNATLSAIPGLSGANNFFWRGMMETANSWRVFLLVAFVSLILCFVYTFVLRLIIKPLVWLSLILVFCLIMFLGYLMYEQANKLRDENEGRNDVDAERYEKAWRYTAYIVWGLGIIYLIVLVWSRERINTACAIIQVSGRVIGSYPIMLIVPPVSVLGSILIALWAIYVALYLYTADDYSKGGWQLKEVPGNVTDNSSSFTNFIVSGNKTYANFTAGFLESDNAKRNLLFFDLFGFLWTLGFINAFCFMLIAFCTVFWYYSSLRDDEKCMEFGLPRAFCWTFCNHLGTIAVGSFLIALVQFAQFLLYYVEKTCAWAKESEAAKCIISIAKCCLACMERTVKIISTNAYCYTCITSEAFCCAAKDAFNAILDHCALLSILSIIVEFVFIFGKILIVIACCCLAWTLMDDPEWAPEVETKIFPLILCAIIVYIFASIFFNVYGTTIDATFICYAHDLKNNAGAGAYYAPIELADQIKNYDPEKAVKRYEAGQKAEAQGNEPYPSENKKD